MHQPNQNLRMGDLVVSNGAPGVILDDNVFSPIRKIRTFQGSHSVWADELSVDNFEEVFLEYLQSLPQSEIDVIECENE